MGQGAFLNGGVLAIPQNGPAAPRQRCVAATISGSNRVRIRFHNFTRLRLGSQWPLVRDYRFDLPVPPENGAILVESPDHELVEPVSPPPRESFAGVAGCGTAAVRISQGVCDFGRATSVKTKPPSGNGRSAAT